MLHDDHPEVVIRVLQAATEEAKSKGMFTLALQLMMAVSCNQSEPSKRVLSAEAMTLLTEQLSLRLVRRFY